MGNSNDRTRTPERPDATDGDGDALTFEAARAAFATAGEAWDPDACRDSSTRLVMSDQNPFRLKVAVYGDDLKDDLAASHAFAGCVVDQLDRALAYVDETSRDAAARRAPDDSDDPHAIVSPVPERALREALVNALMHRDYADYPGATIVSVLPSSIEVVSLGGLYGDLTINDLLNGASQPRNAELAELFERLGLARNVGRGIQRIMAAYDDAIDAPQLRVAPSSVAVILPLLRVAKPDIKGGTGANGNPDGGASGPDAANRGSGRDGANHTARKYRFPYQQGRFVQRIADGDDADQIELRRVPVEVPPTHGSGNPHDGRPAPLPPLSLPLVARPAKPLTDPALRPATSRLDHSHVEAMTLAFIIERGVPITRVEIQERFNLSKAQVNYALRGLTAAGKVRRVGNSRATRYEAVTV
ncbi:ATP-binding protein [Bifidobacterium avesanii]|uniref:Transcriptional regulator n=1 Tax=Bifidobacterium avesanii TaxID=1798157 RepID=A0A7K3TGW2_9BIFI|nr:ATP-binding protein [Bifidobacterium avesanii]KAB8291454.1 transcriptional regulator [Bifidobacterium avesanii]NEG77914.1 hypothetical protein [Bifidobacterium avesanii]